jgi:hypothetical protein
MLYLVGLVMVVLLPELFDELIFYLPVFIAVILSPTNTPIIIYAIPLSLVTFFAVVVVVA